MSVGYGERDDSLLSLHGKKLVTGFVVGIVTPDSCAISKVYNEFHPGLLYHSFPTALIPNLFSDKFEVIGIKGLLKFLSCVSSTLSTVSYQERTFI